MSNVYIFINESYLQILRIFIDSLLRWIIRLKLPVVKVASFRVDRPTGVPGGALQLRKKTFRKVDVCDIDPCHVGHRCHDVKRVDRLLDDVIWSSARNACNDWHSCQNVIHSSRPFLNEMEITGEVAVIRRHKHGRVVGHFSVFNSFQKLTKDPVNVADPTEVDGVDFVEE